MGNTTNPDTQAAIAAVKKLHPYQLIAALRVIAWDMEVSANELQAAWQDKNAGKFWEIVAKDFNRTADKAEKFWDKTGS